MISERSTYPAILTPDEEDGGFVVAFPDVPEAITQGDSHKEALYMAQDALRLSLDVRIHAWEPLPTPSPPQPDQELIRLPHLVEAKLAIYHTLREQNLDAAALCKRLRSDLHQVSQLLDLYHDTEIGMIEAALAALGKRMALHVTDAA